jgi:D-alanyl-lipoteichoic acid acyltransferase DltB (MBOAT superfamily)
MLFNSFVFFVFLAVVLPIFYCLPTKTSKNVFLLIASYVFYGYWDWRFCALLILSTIIDFYIGLKIHNARTAQLSKRYFLVSLITNLGILGVFKYFNFFIESFQALSEKFGWQLDMLHLNVILPVGISFYTFQTLSYSIDVYRKKLKPADNIIDFALFVSIFPQLVAGPIERASDLLPQLTVKLKPSIEQIKQGVVLIVMGLFRKVIIGDSAGRYVDNIFSNMAHYSSYELIFGLVMFSIQIYADFSGYSHIARGTAKMLGVELMKNFEQPYLSQNITEFWRRWHISLSTWLKDYLYIALGGNRKGTISTYVNIIITMLLGGLWHGASWNFVIWGGLHGIYLSAHKMMLKGEKIPERITKLNLSTVLKVFLTYCLVLFTWLFFRSTSWDMTTLYFSKIYYWEKTEHATILTVVMISFVSITLLLDYFEYVTKKHTFLLNIKSWGVKVGILLALFIVSIAYMFQSEPLPFIYFQF